MTTEIQSYLHQLDLMQQICDHVDSLYTFIALYLSFFTSATFGRGTVQHILTLTFVHVKED